MPYTPVLPSLSVREAITDAVHRCTLSFDAADQGLFESAFTRDAVFAISGRPPMNGIAAIQKDCFDVVSKLVTTHTLSGIRLQHHEGASAAHITCTAVAEHFKRDHGLVPGAPSLTSGSIYDFDLVKDADSDLWRIRHWDLQLLWLRGDHSLISG